MNNAKRTILIVMVVCVRLAQADPSFISKDTTLYKYLMKFAATEPAATKLEKPDTPPADIPAPTVKSDHKTDKQEFRPTPNHNYKKTSYKKSSYKKSPQTANLSGLTEDTTFGMAIDMLINSIEPKLPIVVLWNDLEENAGIDRDTPAGIRAVPGVSLRKHLELLLLSVSAKGMEKLGYTIDGGVIVVATKNALPNKMSARSYHIGELLSRPSTGFGGMGMGGMGMGGMGMGGMGMGGMGMGGFGNTGFGNYGSSYGNQGAGQLMNTMQPFISP